MSDLSMMIAIGIGLHNFAEGLAVGSSAARGALQLAVLLVIGFGLHNATEGFGIVAPMAAEGRGRSWRYLLVLGLIGGGPTLLGTLVGQRVVNDTLSIGFLTLAAGSILYVVIELLAVARSGDSFANMPPVGTPGHKPQAWAVALTQSEYPTSATPRHSPHIADFACWIWMSSSSSTMYISSGYVRHNLDGFPYCSEHYAAPGSCFPLSVREAELARPPIDN